MFKASSPEERFSFKRSCFFSKTVTKRIFNFTGNYPVIPARIFLLPRLWRYMAWYRAQSSYREQTKPYWLTPQLEDMLPKKGVVWEISEIFICTTSHSWDHNICKPWISMDPWTEGGKREPWVKTTWEYWRQKVNLLGIRHGTQYITGKVIYNVLVSSSTKIEITRKYYVI